MARLNVAPTKSVQLNLRRDLEMATEGFNLLEQKREILVMELMRLLENVKSVQQELTAKRDRAYATLRRAIAQNGYFHTRNVATGLRYDHQVILSTHVVAGFRMPAIQVHPAKFHSQYGFAATDSLIDQTQQHFLEMLQTVTRLAELETTVIVLARELKKTQRRVNALEHLFIPDYKETLRYIGESLESRELDAFFTNKMIKKRLEAAAAGAHEPEPPKTQEEETP